MQLSVSHVVPRRHDGCFHSHRGLEAQRTLRTLGGALTQTLTPPTQGQSFSRANPAASDAVLYSFTGGSRFQAAPVSGLTKLGNLFYGTTGCGGAYDKGVIFSISPDGSGFTELYSFKTAGSWVNLINVDGPLYGTNQNGGTGGKGSVFSITPAGAFATLYSFKGGDHDGAQPEAALTNVRGTLYGATYNGGKVPNGEGGCQNSTALLHLAGTAALPVRVQFLA